MRGACPLRKGLFDFSIEAGFARTNFGTQSNNYAEAPIGIASARYGATDKLTIEDHGEFAEDFLLVGGGATATVADRLLVSAAGSASLTDAGHGYLLYGSLDTEFNGIHFTASSQRTFGDYSDLATITAIEQSDSSKLPGSIVSGADFPKAFDRVTVGFPLAEMGAGFNVSYIHIDTASQPATHLVSATYAQRLFSDISMTAAAFADLEDISAVSVFVGLTIPLGGHSNASTGFSHDPVTGPRGTVTYARALSQEPGSIGWRLRDSEGQTPVRAAAVSYRGSKAQGEATVRQIDDSVTGTLSVDGAVAIAGGGVFLANRIDDAFAVVDVGAPDVGVTFENRPAGHTDASGRLLVTGLRSYQRNKIAIDPHNLPVNASIPTTKTLVVPGDRGGITVGFGVETETRSAVVVLADAHGQHLPVASTGTVAETSETFVVGYGGRTFIENLSGHNTLHVALDGSSCSAGFAFQPREDAQIEIGPLVCQ